jgi:hypothetical protein
MGWWVVMQVLSTLIEWIRSSIRKCQIIPEDAEGGWPDAIWALAAVEEGSDGSNRRILPFR